MSDETAKGADKAIELAERSILGSVLASDGGEIPPRISRILDFAPNSFENNILGQVALAIKLARKNGTAPTVIEIMPHLSGESVAVAQELSNTESLPLSLADLDAEPLLKRWQSRKLIAVLGEAWEEARNHPDKAGAVSKSIIKVIEQTMSEAPDRRLPPMVDTALFVKQKLETSPHIVHGLLHKGTKIVIGGGSKSFKTWVQLDMAMSVAYGLPWMGFETTLGRVLFVNLEIKEEFFQKRLIDMAAAKSIELMENRLIAWNLRGESAPYFEIVPKMIEDLHKSDFCLSLLDPIYKLMLEETDPAKLDRLASAQTRLSTQERELDGRPLLAAVKTSSKASRQRQAEPEPMPEADEPNG